MEIYIIHDWFILMCTEIEMDIIEYITSYNFKVSVSW